MGIMDHRERVTMPYNILTDLLVADWLLALVYSTGSPRSRFGNSAYRAKVNLHPRRVSSPSLITHANQFWHKPGVWIYIVEMLLAPDR